MERSTLFWYWRIVSSFWSFIPPFIFGSCSFPWKSLLPLNNNYWLFLIYCAWCIVVYWCNSSTIVHFSLDIIEYMIWLKYKLKKFWNCTWYWFTPLSISTRTSEDWGPSLKKLLSRSVIISVQSFDLSIHPLVCFRCWYWEGGESVSSTI